MAGLAWYLAIALVMVMIGLVALAFAAILDIMAAQRYALEIEKNALRLTVLNQRPDPTVPEEREALLAAETVEVGRSAVRISDLSLTTAGLSLLALVLAFGTVALGILHLLRQA